MSDQVTPQAGSSRQGYRALEFAAVTPRGVTTRPMIEAPPSESGGDDADMEDILSRGVESSGPYHSYGQTGLSPDDLGPAGSHYPAGFTARIGSHPHRTRPPPSSTSTRQRVDTRGARGTQPPRPALTQTQYDCLFESIIKDAQQEFDRQRKQI